MKLMSVESGLSASEHALPLVIPDRHLTVVKRTMLEANCEEV